MEELGEDGEKLNLNKTIGGEAAKPLKDKEKEMA